MLLPENSSLIEALIEKKFSLFHPRSRESIRQDFPEVDKIPSLQTLDNEDLLFCWFMGCQCSPVRNSSLPESDKIEVSAKVSYPRKWERKAAELTKNMPDTMLSGIRAFQTMRLDVRVQTLLMHENTLINARAVLSINVRDTFVTKEGKPDMEAMEQWAKTAKVMNALIADVVPLCEGLGVSEVKGDMDFLEGEIMALLHAKHST